MIALLCTLVICICVAGLSVKAVSIFRRRTLQSSQVSSSGCCGIAMTSHSRAAYTRFHAEVGPYQLCLPAALNSA